MSSQKKKSAKSRRSISLDTKMEILKLYEMGHRCVDIANSLKLPATTVHSIYQCKDKIKKCAGSTTSQTLGTIKNVSTNLIKVKMESMLSHWIEEQTEKKIQLNAKDIMDKARVLYSDISELEGPASEPFIASRGWYHRFCKRSRLSKNNIPESPDEISKSKHESLVTTFKNIIEKEQYLPAQVFSIKETFLYWKSMPKNSQIYKEDTKNNSSNLHDRVTLLLSANAEGDFKLKPILLYHIKNPPALKGYAKSNLPVIWRTHPRATITQAVFQDWFLNNFEPAVRSYCKEKKLSNKALLILDDSPCYPKNLDNLYPHIQVVYFPYTDFRDMQPIDNGIFNLFKCYYLRIQLTKLFKTKIDANCKGVWTDYNIMNAVENISEAWDEISSNNINVFWHKLWNECVRDSKCHVTLEKEIERLVELGRDIKLEGIGEEDIVEWLSSHEKVLVKRELTEPIADFDHSDHDDDTEEVREIKTKDLVNLFTQAENLIKKISEMDPIKERSMRVCRDMRRAYSCYVHIYREKMRQRTTQKKVTIDSSESSSSSSGSDVEMEDSSVKESNGQKLKSEQIQFIEISMVESSHNE